MVRSAQVFILNKQQRADVCVLNVQLIDSLIHVLVHTCIQNICALDRDVLKSPVCVYLFFNQSDIYLRIGVKIKIIKRLGKNAKNDT